MLCFSVVPTSATSVPASPETKRLLPCIFVCILQLRGFPELQEQAYLVNDVLGTKLPIPEAVSADVSTGSNRSLATVSDVDYTDNSEESSGSDSGGRASYNSGSCDDSGMCCNVLTNCCVCVCTSSL
jgi:hypothetical protein